MGGRARNNRTIELQQLDEQGRVLRQRLHRVVVALAMTEELRAVMLRRVAAEAVGETPHWQSLANCAERAAQDCRSFARRIEE